MLKVLKKVKGQSRMITLVLTNPLNSNTKLSISAILQKIFSILCITFITFYMIYKPIISTQIIDY